VLVGPAEGWKIDDHGALVGATTGRPLLLLDDLRVALRAAGGPVRSVISCSIDPTQEGLQRLTARSITALRHLDLDSAELEQRMHRRPPKNAVPAQADRLASRAELVALVRAAFPNPAHPSAGKRALGGDNQSLPARAKHPADLRQARPRIGQVLDHPAQHDAVEHFIAVGQASQVGHDRARSVALQALAAPLKHGQREVEAANMRVRRRAADAARGR